MCHASLPVTLKYVLSDEERGISRPSTPDTAALVVYAKLWVFLSIVR